MITELNDLLRSKTFTIYTCSPLYSFRCHKNRLKARGSALLDFLLNTNRYRLENDPFTKRNAAGNFIKNVISHVEYKELQIKAEDNIVPAPLYRITINMKNETKPLSTTEIIFFPSSNSTLPDDFYSYPLLLCRGDSQLLLFMYEWLQGFFNCTITRNPVSAQVLTSYVWWYSQNLYSVAAEDEEDVYDLLSSKRDAKLEYYLEGVPDLQHISIRIKAFDLIRLQESIQGKDDNIMGAIEQFILKNTSVNIGALTLRTVITSLVAFHLDGKVKFTESASPHFIYSILQDLSRTIETGRDQSELLKPPVTSP